jgi:hypothetical protein
MNKDTKVWALIAKWESYRATISEPSRYCQLKNDLYQVRNPGFNGSPLLTTWPTRLIDDDDEIMASVEQYFLARSWVGTGRFPAWELRLLRNIYNFGKRLGVVPRHNPNRAVTPPSELQRRFQDQGVRDGERDLYRWGQKKPKLATVPPMYF